jgi:copper homeostasis protein
VARVLTSGGAPTAIEGAPRLAALVGQADGRITVMACGRVRAHNVAALLAATGVREVHARLAGADDTRALVEACRR